MKRYKFDNKTELKLPIYVRTERSINKTKKRFKFFAKENKN